MKSKALHGCIQYVREHVRGIEEARHYNQVLGLDDNLPRIDYSTMELLVGRIRTYDSVFSGVEDDTEDDTDYTQEDIDGESDNLALQEPDIYL